MCSAFRFFIFTLLSALVAGNYDDFLGRNFNGFPPLPGADLFRNTNLPGENFTFSSWSAFSQCDKACGGGSAQRSRTCQDESGSQVPIMNCDRTQNRNPLELLRKFLNGETLLTEVEQLTCNIRPCDTSEWGEWSSCSYPCGGGVQTSTRTCIDDTDQRRCNVQMVRSRRCGTQPCFRFSEWTEWGNCTRKCEGGEQRRQRICAPGLNNDDPSYPALFNILNQFQSLAGFRLNLFNSGSNFYLTEYQRSCTGPREERQRCNNQRCPECPANQQYYHCKPCVRRCQRLEGAQYYVVESVQNLLLGSQLCSPPVCESGCGCSFFSPYLGSDQRCYTIQQQCPINQVNRGITDTGTDGFGRSFQSTIGPGQVTPRPTIPPTTTTVQTFPTTSEVETSPTSTEPPERSGGEPEPIPCAYDIIIATLPGHIPCVCVGTANELQCYKDERTSCPIICMQDS